MTKLKIGVVVPFYNGHQYLDKLIESFDVAAAGLDCVLYVIDNSPADQVISMSYKSKMAVEVIREKPGIGYGRANNRGYELCKELGFDFIIIANQDAYVSPNFIRDLLFPFSKDDTISVSAPLLKTYEGDAIEDFFIRYYVSQVPVLVSDLLIGKQKDYYELEKISGACFAFRLKDESYKYPYLFDPIFHMYMEDEDLCYRLARINRKVVLSLSAIFYHQHSHTTDFKNREFIETDKLTSGNIIRLKNDQKNVFKTLYGIFATTTGSVTHHILRGEFKKVYSYSRAFALSVLKIPKILRIRRENAGHIDVD